MSCPTLNLKLQTISFTAKQYNAKEQQAEAEKAERQTDADAKFYEVTQEADAKAKKAEAELQAAKAEAVASPLSNIDNMTVYGSDGGSKLVGDMMQSINQISEGVGLNIPDLLASTLTGRAMATGSKQADVTKEVTTEDAE